MTRQLFEAGHTIFEQGDLSDQTYRIVAGSVDIVVIGRDGSEKRIASLGPEEFFGEMGIIDPAPRSATAIAREATVCDVLPAENVIDLLSSDPKQVTELVRTLILRLRASNRKLASSQGLGPPRKPGAH